MDDQLQNEVVLGVDTHLDVNVGAVINHTGKLLGIFQQKLARVAIWSWWHGRVHWAVFNVPASRALGRRAPALLAFHASKEFGFSKSTGLTGVSVV